MLIEVVVVCRTVSAACYAQTRYQTVVAMKASKTRWSCRGRVLPKLCRRLPNRGRHTQLSFIMVNTPESPQTLYSTTTRTPTSPASLRRPRELSQDTLASVIRSHRYTRHSPERLRQTRQHGSHTGDSRTKTAQQHQGKRLLFARQAGKVCAAQFQSSEDNADPSAGGPA